MLVNPTEAREQGQSVGLSVVEDLYGETGAEAHRYAWPVTESQEQQLMTRLAKHVEAGGHLALIGDNPNMTSDSLNMFFQLGRIMAASYYFPDFPRLDKAAKQHFAADRRVMLVATVDVDDAGHTLAPEDHWKDRVRAIAGGTMPDPAHQGLRQPTVDLIVGEGESSRIENHLAFAQRLSELGLLGSWFVFNQDRQTLVEARRMEREHDMLVVELS